MKVTSKDGAIISCAVIGAGPALLLISGISWFERWKAVVPHLEPIFTVYQMTRRGKGESSDGVNYALEREIEDILAVLTSIGGQVNVLAHSFGGLCALEAAIQKPKIRKLILYEPPLALNGPAALQPILDRMQTFLDDGERELVWEMYVREISPLPETEIQRQRSLPEHDLILSSIHTTLREVRAVNDYQFLPNRFRTMNIPTLLLLGEKTSERMSGATLAIHAALPKSKVIVLPGQKHFAMDSAPDLFLQTIINYLNEKDEG